LELGVFLAFSSAMIGQQITSPAIPNLAGYLAAHPWDVQKKGPLIVLTPNEVTAKTGSGGLIAFGRKEFRVGSLTAIAPSEMVLIDDELKELPNLYEGLPRLDKIVYLMSLLDAGQWKTACSVGIGLTDLRQDQRAVYKSILPSTFSYENYVWGDRGGLVHPPGDQPQTVTLTSDEEAGVRLCFSKHVGLGVRTTDGARTNVAPQPADWQKPGGPALLRKDVAMEDRTTLFGVQIRKVVDNRLKPSNLDTKLKSLNRPISLAPKMTIDEICRLASAASGLRLMADVRIGSLTVETVGQSARAGDVLQALALCVTGSYRKVGDITILTSDLEGIGTKRLRLAFWKWDVEMGNLQRKREWGQAIRANGGARNIAFKEELLPLNDAMAQFMETDRNSARGTTMPASELPSQWQQVLTKGQTRLSQEGMNIRTDIVEPTESVSWNFVLPDGRSLLPEGADIGQLNSLLPRNAGTPGPPAIGPVKPIPIRSGAGTALVFKTDEPSVAAGLPALAQTHGFEEIWLQTWDSKCLAALIDSASRGHTSVRLVVKPWELPKGIASADPDVTLLGNTASQATHLQEQTQYWQTAQSNTGRSPSEVGDSMGPGDPVRQAIWKGLMDLAGTPGLAGTVLLQTEPPGYEPTVSDEMYAPEELMFAGDLGYTRALRSRFLAAHGVDPVDFVDRRLRFGHLDLSLPMFGDPSLMPARMTDAIEESNGFDKQWLALRSEANRSAVAELVSRVPGAVCIQQRPMVQDRPQDRGFAIVPWQIGSELPTTLLPPNEQESSVSGDGYWVWPLGFPIEKTAAYRISQNLSRHIQRHPLFRLAVDMSSVPQAELARQLDAWFQRE